MPNYQGVWSLSTQLQNKTGWPFRIAGDVGVINKENDAVDFIIITTTVCIY